VDLKDGDLYFKPGFDLFYQINPSITAALTVNTDFAEAEVDERRVNLTRFPLFFPEKRAFFLQDAGIFSSAASCRTRCRSSRAASAWGRKADPADSRRRQITGARLHQLGLLDVQMQHDDQLATRTSASAGLRLTFLKIHRGRDLTHGDPTTPGK